MDIIIRKATPNDYEEINHVRRITWLDTYPNQNLDITKEEIEAKFNNMTKEGHDLWRKSLEASESSCSWVATNNNKIVGFCRARKKRSFNEIGATYILPEYQGRGMGKLLLTEALSWLGSDKNIHLTVAAYNTRAIRFYEERGFVKTSKEVGSKVCQLPFGSIMPECEMVKAAE
ncbi:hypothetical protein A2Y26_00770 [candidate division CPR2 bacterium GWD2_39_7]|nr:MAG: Acetyltransferase, GNAT family [candidate division CPR2 bacterium GW2011_GWC2_39_35]KKR27297.1 MAG: Acetyltransferase, GNAT family [candidate division CPR2 bacterium GW2011_GWD2_39_7]KKR28222.1 MAG: Acetyltransferase, GNAT family [candidate division CPR2 bacterium GW2011_GWD1_39_7]OGB60422.1 MAG: hypothetical protein A2Y27_00215 [candidate division CPR2 bacterium GWD1_39_7]OGB70516.1 MAG: hypothetical protein A2Y26_00770 [candidate division CPR2 bacterium GWD2_39_7]HCL99741.1 hypotheti